jgi:DNA polymerase-3 subunit gamma/tau
MKALYNKYRPSGLDAVRGQEHVKRVLIGQIKSSDVFHAYIFSGPAGTGKTTCARIFAAMMNCSTGPNIAPPPDDPNAKIILSGKCPVDVYEMDAASNNGIEDVREWRKSAYHAPLQMDKKVYIIDECHRLSPQAWDGLLKIIEEPPAHLVFIFCTTNPDKIAETIKTRCMTLDFKDLSPADVYAEVNRISAVEGIKIDDDAARMIGNAARGSLRQAINWLGSLKADDQTVTTAAVMGLIGTTPRVKARDFVLAALKGEYASALASSSSVIAAGGSGPEFLSEAAKFCHDVMMTDTKGYDWSAIGYSSVEVDDLKKARAALTERGDKLHAQIDHRKLMSAWIKILQNCTGLSVFNVQPQFQIDTAYVDMYYTLVGMVEKTQG